MTVMVNVIELIRVAAILETLPRPGGLGESYLFNVHKIGVIEYLADHVAVMQAGRIVEQGVGESVLQRPQHEYTRTLLASVPRVAVVG